MKRVVVFSQMVAGLVGFMGFVGAEEARAIAGNQNQLMDRFCVDSGYTLTLTNGALVCRSVSVMPACPSGQTENSLSDGMDVCINGSSISVKVCPAPSDSAISVSTKIQVGNKNDLCAYDRAPDLPSCAEGYTLLKESDAGKSIPAGNTVGKGDHAIRPKYTCRAIAKPSLRSPLSAAIGSLTLKSLDGVSLSNLKSVKPATVRPSDIKISVGAGSNPAASAIEGVAGSAAPSIRR